MTRKLFSVVLAAAAMAVGGCGGGGGGGTQAFVPQPVTPGQFVAGTYVGPFHDATGKFHALGANDAAVLTFTYDPNVTPDGAHPNGNLVYPDGAKPCIVAVGGGTNHVALLIALTGSITSHDAQGPLLTTTHAAEYTGVMAVDTSAPGGSPGNATVDVTKQ